MSRIGKKPIPVPQGVKVAVQNSSVHVEGPKGALAHTLPAGITVSNEPTVLTVNRSSDHRTVRALHAVVPENDASTARQAVDRLPQLIADPLVGHQPSGGPGGLVRGHRSSYSAGHGRPRSRDRARP